MVGRTLKSGELVIYESTVFPGATEEYCVPVLERSSGLKFNQQFFVGYSPERINPGDKNNKLANILKVTSGSTPEIADFVDALYSEIIHAGTYKAASIKVAEAAKVIENTQRDLNIAFMNELVKIFNALEINTTDVLNAASTKWNFLPFQPGFVGGHCIGVDPYYLSHKAKMLKVNPEVILSGRRTNDNMPKFIFKQIQKRLKNKAKILFLGITFKEDVPDLRNSKAIELLNYFKNSKFNISINDPFIANNSHIKYNDLMVKSFDAIILTVPHTFYKTKFSHIKQLLKKDGILFDIKGIFRNKTIEKYWSL